MMLRYVEPKIASSMKLKNLLNRDRANALGSQHPMHGGFAAIDRVLRGNGASEQDHAAIAELEFFADAVVEHMLENVREGELANDLARTSSCRSMWFEAQVLRLVVEPNVEIARWRRYEEGASDISTIGPQTQVECKLVQTSSVAKLLDRVTDRVDQRRDGEGPFVLVGGLAVPLSDDTIARAAQHVRREHDRWFSRHPEVAAVLLLMPHEQTQVWTQNRFGLTGLNFNRYAALWLRNNKANEPLPKHFDLKPRGLRT